MAVHLALDPERAVFRVTLALPPAVQVLPPPELAAVKEQLRAMVEKALADHLARVRLVQTVQGTDKPLPALELVALVEAAP